MQSNLAYQTQDERRYELINGKIVMMARPSINHNYVSGNIYNIFYNYLKRKTCTPFADGTDLYLTSDNHYVPDGMIICDPDKIKRNYVKGAPDLVVEVLSPRTARDDKGPKKDAYERADVGEYWIVEPERKSVEVYLLQEGKYVLDNIYQMCPKSPWLSLWGYKGTLCWTIIA